jgi:hypothetical protein
MNAQKPIIDINRLITTEIFSVLRENGGQMRAVDCLREVIRRVPTKKDVTAEDLCSSMGWSAEQEIAITGSKHLN